MNFPPLESDARSEWNTWLTEVVPPTDSVIDYLEQNHEMKRPLEYYFNQMNRIIGATSNLRVYERTVVNELQESDWEWFALFSSTCENDDGRY